MIIETTVIEFATFLLKAIAAQSEMKNGVLLSNATDDEALKRLITANKLRQIYRAETPEHL